ncbi:MAG: 3'(2'),5'-bisphosphate nucleotidase CysQ [Pseudomonadota bacterium]
MPATDLSLLVQAVRAAGEVARTFSGPEAKVWQKPGDAGPVTEADLAVNDTLRSCLQGARPGYGWLSEETEDNAERLAHDTVFIVDPIDGTRAFISGGRTWAHVVAVAHKGEVTAGAIYLPLRDKLYAAAKGQGATINGAPICVGTRGDPDGATVLTSKSGLAERHWRSAPPDLQLSFRPSLAYRLCLVAEGRFDAMLSLRRTWEWDIAAGEIVLREAGAITTDRLGQPLTFNAPSPEFKSVVSANPALHGALIRALKPDPR